MEDAHTQTDVVEEHHRQNCFPRACYDHAQLRVLSGHSGRIAALQLNSGRSTLTPVTLAVETVLSLGVDLVVLILDSLPSLCRLVLSLLSNLPLSSVYV